MNCISLVLDYLSAPLFCELRPWSASRRSLILDRGLSLALWICARLTDLSLVQTSLFFFWIKKMHIISIECHHMVNFAEILIVDFIITWLNFTVLFVWFYLCPFYAKRIRKQDYGLEWRVSLVLCISWKSLTGIVYILLIYNFPEPI